MNNDDAPPHDGDTGAFQKMWMEMMAEMMRAGSSQASYSPPPEVLRHIRSGNFQAMAQSWEEFMRSPQYLQSAKQWTDNAVAFRKMCNEFMAKARGELGLAFREDIDAFALEVRQRDKRLSEKIDELSALAGDLHQMLEAIERRLPADKPATGKRRSRKASGRRGMGLRDVEVI